MAARFNLYCKRTVAKMTPKELLDGTLDADLHTIAEDTVPEDEIVAALKQLRAENVQPPSFVRFRLCYRPAGSRQIDVERWATPEEVEAVAAEMIEEVEAKEHPARAAIRAHLERVVDVVSASFGSSPEEKMAPVLASEAARWLAQEFEGIIFDPDGERWTLGDHGAYQPLPM